MEIRDDARRGRRGGETTGGERAAGAARKGMTMKSLLIGSAALALAACHITEARMALPVGLAPATSRVELTGMGGSQEGSFQLGNSAGRFTRRAERLGVFDPLFVANYGGGGFTVSGPDLAGELTARCGYRQQALSVGVVSVKPGGLRYSCAFSRDGAPVAADFELRDQSGPLGSLDGRAAREGTMVFEGVWLTIRSVHTSGGGSLPLPTPLGYVLESEGRPVGAIDLNGTDKTLHLPADARLRQASLAAGLALAILWDPAETDD
jgi:hypothetical protein